MDERFHTIAVPRLLVDAMIPAAPQNDLFVPNGVVVNVEARKLWVSDGHYLVLAPLPADLVLCEYAIDAPYLLISRQAWKIASLQAGKHFTTVLVAAEELAAEEVPDYRSVVDGWQPYFNGSARVAAIDLNPKYLGVLASIYVRLQPKEQYPSLHLEFPSDKNYPVRVAKRIESLGADVTSYLMPMCV